MFFHENPPDSMNNSFSENLHSCLQNNKWPQSYQLWPQDFKPAKYHCNNIKTFSQSSLCIIIKNYIKTDKSKYPQNSRHWKLWSWIKKTKRNEKNRIQDWTQRISIIRCNSQDCNASYDTAKDQKDLNQSNQWFPESIIWRRSIDAIWYGSIAASQSKKVHYQCILELGHQNTILVDWAIQNPDRYGSKRPLGQIRNQFQNCVQDVLIWKKGSFSS